MPRGLNCLVNPSGGAAGADIRGGGYAKIRTYIAEVEKIPEENIQIDRIESRPPTESETDFLLEWGEEPPELMWFADVTRLFGGVGPRAGIIWLDAHTGEIIYGSFLD